MYGHIVYPPHPFKIGKGKEVESFWKGGGVEPAEV